MAVKIWKRSPRCPAPGPPTRRLRAPLLRKRPRSRASPRSPRALADRDPERAGVDFLARDSRPGNRRLRVSSASRRPPRGRFPFQRGGVRRPELVSEFTPAGLPPERAVRGTRPSRSFRAVIVAPSLRWPKPSLWERQRRLVCEAASELEQGGRRTPRAGALPGEANTHKAK